MRILHVIPSVAASSGGPAEGLRQLCRIYRLGGHEVHVASLDAPAMVAGVGLPAKVFGLGPGRGTYGYSRRAAAWFEQNITAYDVVFLNGVWQYDALAAYRALMGTNVPYAVFAHGMLDPYFKQRFPLKHIKKSIYWYLFLEPLLRNAKAVLFTCEEEKLLARYSFPRYVVREMVVPFGTFVPECDLRSVSGQFLDRWPELRGKRLVLSMGRIHQKKGIDLLLRGFAEALGRDESWHLIIAGSDEMGQQRKLVKLANALRIGSRVTWTGMLGGTLKWGAFAAAEVLGHPSHQENFGIAIAEAMACGLPVIVSKRVNIWRDVERSGAGLVCEDSVEGVRESLSQWAELEDSEVAAMGLRSRKCFDDRYNYERLTGAVLGVVDRVAGRVRSPLRMPGVAVGMASRDS